MTEVEKVSDVYIYACKDNDGGKVIWQNEVFID